MNHQDTDKTFTSKQIEQWCNQTLQANDYKDYCPNGLQVDADKPISKVVTGVTACMDLIEYAISVKADALLVHHGYFWKGEPSQLTGMKGARIRKLMQHGISLFAYHLPLDGHETLGNNAQLIQMLELDFSEHLYPEFAKNKALVGDIALARQQLQAKDLAQKIETVLKRTPLHINVHDKPITKIGICSGGAQDFIEQAAHMDCDAYISGEISERTTHQARELGIHYFACGHHATERAGVKALGEKMQNELGLEVIFKDIDNPA